MSERKIIPEDLKFEIFKLGKITGSQMFGGSTEESDIDIMIPAEDFNFYHQIRDHIFKIATEYQYQEALSVYVEDSDEKIINIIFFTNQKYFDNWSKATDLLVDLCQESKIFKDLVKEKEYRLELFETCKKIIYLKESKNV